ncbi:MAG: glycosyltransferase [Bacteroidales bacterium]|nr:glycosyltransferase [Bacteroidales bacterium]
MKKNITSILIYNSNEPLPKQGGMELVTNSLANGLKERGFNVILLCKNKNRLGDVYTPPVPLYFIPDNNPQEYIKQIISNNNITHIIDQGEGEIIGRFGFFRKRDIFFKDIVMIAVQHSSAMSIINNYRIIMKKSYNNKCFNYIYNNIILLFRKIHSTNIIKSRYKELNSNYDKIVTLSPSFIDDFIKFTSKANKDKLIAIPNMNRYERVNIPSKDNRVLFVGRLYSEVKGCDKLLRIWKEATKDIKDWHLDIVGDGRDKQNLIELAKELDIKNCSFHGHCDPQPFYEKAQIFCMTSIYEGFGMVLTEAMQHGVVPMAFNSYSSVHDIITDNKDGYIIPAFNEKVYAKSLRELINNKNIRTKFAKEAKISSEKFSKENILNQWTDLIISTFK